MARYSKAEKTAFSKGCKVGARNAKRAVRKRVRRTIRYY